ncbi:MAG: cytochrome P450 [Pseudomonadales bacterium]|nr:cytochrome P450 [Pseudomonadales bacterium]NIX07956.1 cytochrome P450 [Pseudomonadales bacterium]
MAPNAAEIGEFDLRSPPAGFVEDPFPWYEALRADGPVRRMPDGSLLVTGYDACSDVYRNQAFISDKRNLFKPKFGDSPLYEHHTTSLVFNDPPYHTRVRRTIVEALKPRSIQATVDMLTRRIQELLASMRESGEADLIEAYASRIPVEVICSLLTVPTDDRDDLRRWSLAILGALEPSISESEAEAGNHAVTEFLEYLKALIAERRRRPLKEDSVLSSLLAQQDRGELSEIELLHNCIFLLNAGHETTTNLIGNGIHMLLTHETERDRLLRDSARIKSAVEEILRFQSPNQLGNREVVMDATVGGRRFQPGDQVTLCIGAANRDPSRFPEPDSFLIDRAPNPHLAFAAGPHTCAGMALARIEGKLALSAFFEAFPQAALAQRPSYRDRIRFRGLAALHVRLHGT